MTRPVEIRLWRGSSGLLVRCKCKFPITRGSSSSCSGPIPTKPKFKYSFIDSAGIKVIFKRRTNLLEMIQVDIEHRKTVYMLNINSQEINKSLYEGPVRKISENYLPKAEKGKEVLKVFSSKLIEEITKLSKEVVASEEREAIELKTGIRLRELDEFYPSRKINISDLKEKLDGLNKLYILVTKLRQISEISEEY